MPFLAGRDLKCVSATVGGVPLRFATTHLESPLRWDQLFSTQRVAQCKQVRNGASGRLCYKQEGKGQVSC